MHIGTPNRRNAGYLMSNNTAQSQRKVEADVQTCSHCQAVVILGKEGGNYCGKCSHVVCDQCGARMDKYGCEPFLRKLERAIGASEQYEKFLKEAGMVTPVPPQPILTRA